MKHIFLRLAENIAKVTLTWTIVLGTIMIGLASLEVLPHSIEVPFFWIGAVIMEIAIFALAILVLIAFIRWVLK